MEYDTKKDDLTISLIPREGEKMYVKRIYNTANGFGESIDGNSRC